MIRSTLVQKVVIKNPQQDSMFLLLTRSSSDKSRPGDYDIPGGSLKSGELHESALKREVFEETRLEISDIKPVLINTDYDIEVDKYFIYIGYTASISDLKVSLNKDEHSDFTWLTLKEFEKKSPNHILMRHLNEAM